MGQRHQYIVLFPELFYNDGNPNNRPAEARIIHHQWLYGVSAVMALSRVVKLVSNSLDGDGTDHMFGTGDGGTRLHNLGINAISAAISVDPDSGYFHAPHIYDEPVVPPCNVSPMMLDNNDGVTVIQFIAGSKTPRVCFATPRHLEGPYWHPSHGCGPWSPEEYLGFYYTPAELDEHFDADVVANALRIIRGTTEAMTAAQLTSALPLLRTGVI